MNISRSAYPLIAAVLAAGALTLVVGITRAAIQPAETLAEEQRGVDDAILKADSVELRKLSPRLFQFAQRCLDEKQDDLAQKYLEKGLEADPWALEQQLTLGEVLARHGQPGVLRGKAEMVMRMAEENAVLERAARLLGRAAPEKPRPLSAIPATEQTLALVPLGDVNPVVLEELRGLLAKDLGIPVVLASVDVQIPTADRSAKTQWISRSREHLSSLVKEHPQLAVQLAQWGFTEEQLAHDDQAVVTVMRKATGQEQGAAAVEALDKMLAQMESTAQWNVEKLLPLLGVGTGDFARPRRLVLGVTSCDLFGGKSNYLFGAAPVGRSVGLISVHRFRAAFNEEPPDRKRLVERLGKQACSTFGFMLGVPRCTTPECVRAFPQSLVELDRKPVTFCPVCREGIEKALGQKLPEK